MWQEAITAVQSNNESWITQHRRHFIKFFREQNIKPKGKLNKTALQEHYNTRLFKMYLPKALGGLELPLHIGSRWIENASTLDSNWGWLLAIGTGGAYFADYMPSTIAEKFFLPEEALVAGSGKPDGKAVNRNNGFKVVSGTWSYCSGAEQASLFTAVVPAEQGNLAVILPVDKVEIIRDWNAIGLPLTCSHTIVAKEITVSEEYFFDLTQTPRKSTYPLATYPFLLFARACFVPVLIGISLSFWKEVESLLIEKETVWKKYQPERYKYVKERMEDFASRVLELKEDFYSTLEESWKEHQSGGDLQEKELSEKSFEIADHCYRSSAEILPVLGMNVLDQTHPIQLLWQDLQTAGQHAVFQNYV
ncbi:hypothetical protein GCM10007103_19090 [Salinimicrobium marinum]|uniref:Acyl-CoA dehydrogenase n=1 Tax=Salinimicrobium marinum TaxID=680283 RepID=A0A918VYT5_9FLAO|nr:hypothetical protein [Salinimicrobium marinum]GHA37760.1 hypothetical protein GCM10007103_19090 [Salinimicrobium marinum]